MMRAGTVSRAGLVLGAILFPGVALAQSCPAPLTDAKRLVLVVADNFTTSAASVQRFERVAGGSWRAIGGPASALIGLKGMAWSQAWRSLATRGEPVKYDGDKRVPAGIYPTGSSFGFKARPHTDYLQIREGDVCVDDPSSPAYNTITKRALVGWKVHGENMWRVPDYRNGISVEYPTDAKLRAGSCIFIHVWLPGKAGTAGCVALKEPEVVALQEFVEPGAVLAVLPRHALGRLKGCLPEQ
jgi:L,D-peptidoglycan transpeptidase YkuD (ErfK/YbiS/YcfS/YnhG family)